VKEDAAHIRELIMNTPADSELLTMVSSMIKECGVEKVILRSSTNAEDIPGFTGAGLYKSVSLAVASMDTCSLEQAIKTVWSSVWLPMAFIERYRFGIATQPVAMGILVQPYYDRDSLLANGVAVTSNPLNSRQYAIFMTTFPGGDLRATDSISHMQPGTFHSCD
jgi:phosphoenolpyruvate synthase/pyruvate phosphate dikinase